MPSRFDDYLRDDDSEETPTGQWLITFADMSLLMLTFFILLFSLSSMDTRRFGEISEAMRENLGTQSVKEGAGGEIPQAVDDRPLWTPPGCSASLSSARAGCSIPCALT